MAIDFATAVNAYQKVAKAAQNTSVDKASETTSSGANSFVSMVTDSLKGAVQTGREAEELSLKQISGEADLKDVVTAVANAENTLETVVAVRDKVLSAYQEILRMPI